MKKYLSLIISINMILVLLCGCGSKTAVPEVTPIPEPVVTAEPIDVVTDDMQAIYADSIKDGIYSITVDSSSSMFNIVDCTLTVENGRMSAAMTMGGKGYLYVYMGTAEEAADADAGEYIAFTENEDGSHCYTVPVEALDNGVACAAFSKNKEIWYDRTLVFRADSLPTEAFSDGFIVTAESLGLVDGEYTVEAYIEGGSGRASIETPAKLTVLDGVCTLEVIWSSSNFDYMKVEDKQYFPVNTEGNSCFEIPVIGFDYKMPVIADTVAMSTPHEIAYTIFLNSATIAAVGK